VAGAWFMCVSWAASAHAEPFDLAWTAPEGCPSREEMVAATRARLGERETTAPPELFVRGDVTTQKDGFAITFLVKDAAGAEVGEREMHVQGRSCRALEEPAALVLATMISVVRPRAETPAAPLPPAPAPASEPGAQDVPPAPVTPTPAPASRAPKPGAPPARTPPSRRALGAAGVASVGLLPRAGFGGALRTSYLVRSQLLIGLETSFEVGASVNAGRGEVGFQLLSASILAGVPILQTAKVEIFPVVTVRGGVLRTMPRGFQLVKAEVHPMALAGAGALLRAPLAPQLYAEALPQAEVALIRDVFHASEARTTYFLHQPSLLGARLTVGFGYEFP